MVDIAPKTTDGTVHPRPCHISSPHAVFEFGSSSNLSRTFLVDPASVVKVFLLRGLLKHTRDPLFVLAKYYIEPDVDISWAGHCSTQRRKRVG